MRPETITDMRGPFIGSEAIATGALSRGTLRWNYRAVHPDVYLHKAARCDLYAHTVAAWLWTGRTGIVSGQAAAALHGVTWIGDSTPVELIAKHGRRRPGIVVRDQRIGDDEVVHVANLPVTSPARTALELGRHLELDAAVAQLDALAAVTGLTAEEVKPLERRYQCAPGIRAARVALRLMDGGARDPQESHLRLQLIDAGLPRPRTNLFVGDNLWETRIAMGWDRLKVGVDYDEDQEPDRSRAVQRNATEELFQRLGWMHFRMRPDATAMPAIHRIRDALRRRGRI